MTAAILRKWKANTVSERETAAKIFRQRQADARLTNEQAAELLSINISTIKRKRNGTLPVYPAELRLFDWRIEREVSRQLLAQVLTESRLAAKLGEPTIGRMTLNAIEEHLQCDSSNEETAQKAAPSTK